MIMLTLRRSFILIIIVSFLMIFTATSEASDISVFINGQALQTDVSPQIIQGRTMVPMRVIFEALGSDVDWDGDTRKVTGTKDGTVVVLQIPESVIRIDKIASNLKQDIV